MTEEDLKSFPSYILHPDRMFYRIHRAHNDPLYFARSGAGRFDLIHGDDEPGTCYCALSGIGAFLETFGRVRFVSSRMVEQRSLSTLSLTRPLTLANMTDPRVIGLYGIEGDVSAGADYTEPQRWAVRLFEAGFDGIFYAARHDPSFTERSVAVFGDRELGEKLFEITTEPVSTELIEEACAAHGFTVLPATPLP
jgi:hypothetical protein